MSKWMHYTAEKKVECKTDVYVITLITVLIFAPPSAICFPLYDMETILVFIRIICLLS